jgi:DNA-directed RNA polymerase I subunit RPA2
MKLPRKNRLGAADKGNLDIIAIPYVFRYLCAELAAMGISISLEVS